MTLKLCGSMTDTQGITISFQSLMQKEFAQNLIMMKNSATIHLTQGMGTLQKNTIICLRVNGFTLENLPYIHIHGPGKMQRSCVGTLGAICLIF